MRIAFFILVLAADVPANADTLMVGNKQEHTISFIDLATGKEVARRETGRAPHEMAVSPDGRTAVAVSYREQGYNGDTLHLFDVTKAAKRSVVTLPGHKGLHGLKWIGTGNNVIVTSEVTKNVAVVDVTTGKVLASIPTDQEGSHMVAVSEDGNWAFTANIGSGSLTALDLTRNAKLKDVEVGEGAEAITLSPDGKQLWAGANDVRKVVVFDAATLEKISEFPTEGIPIRIEFSPDGRVVAISEPDKNRVIVVGAANRKPVATIDLGGAGLQSPVTMLFSPDGKRLWVAATGSAAVAEIGTSDWKIARRLDAGKGADGLAYSKLKTSPSN